MTIADVIRRPLIRLAARLSIGAILVGCTAQATPGWTYGPTIPPPRPVGSPVSSPGQATPGAGQSPSTSPTIDITAKNIAFEESQVAAPANVPLTIHFDNEDAGVPHDVAIYQGSAEGKQVFLGNIVTGVTSTDYHVPNLAPGTYTLICTVHPSQMTATLTVK
jgi:plastocyanin